MKSERLRNFIEADKKLKEAEKIKETHRDYVVRLLERCLRFRVKLPQIQLIKQERFSMDEVLLYNWLKTVLDKKDIKRISRQIIDMQKFEEFVIETQFDTTQIPKECYTTKTVNTLRIKHD